MKAHRQPGWTVIKPLRRFLGATLLSMGILSMGITAFAGDGSAGKQSTAESPIGRWRTIDEKSGKVRLSRKAAMKEMEAQKQQQPAQAQPAAPAPTA